MDNKKTEPSAFFKDGKRKTDFVLVHNNATTKSKSGEELQEMQLLDDEGDVEKWRKKFIEEITSRGLNVEDELVGEEPNILCFTKVHIPWELLLKYAEDIHIEAPIQEIPEEEEVYINPSEFYLSKFRIPNIMHQYVPNKPKKYYTSPFRLDMIDKFIGKDDQDSFFSPAQRSRIAYEVLATTPFGDGTGGGVGIDHLVNAGAFYAAFPLHDGTWKNENVTSNQEQPKIKSAWNSNLNERQILYDYWGRWGQWYKYQPLDHIRNYFGEKIAIYFAWLGFYTAWLVPAMVVGVCVFLYGLCTVSNDPILEDVCNASENITLCPICETCPTVTLKSTCFSRQLGYLFDNDGSVFYAIFMSFWAVLFLEFWKRRAASLAHDWSCMDLEELEAPRPEFVVKCESLEYRKKNKITGKIEPSFPTKLRMKRILLGSGVVLMMVSVVIITMISVILYRVFVTSLIGAERKDSINGRIVSSSVIANSTGAILQVIFIMIFGVIYEKLALVLTKWEMHRTQSEFDYHMTFKVFLFQFLNYNSSIFYVAFFKGKFVGYPGNPGYNMFGQRRESCSPAGCQYDLMLQLMWIMVGNQVFNNFLEFLWPKISSSRWLNGKGAHLKKVGPSRMEQDYALAVNDGLFYEYLELILQFGFITIFVASFPLAPVFALLNNWVEIRLDAQKFICQTRRALAERAQNIGIWFGVLSVVSKIAVITNAFLLSFTSDFIERSYYNWNKATINEDYTTWRLAYFQAESCYYFDFRDDQGNLTLMYWKILALKLAFIIAFVHFVVGIGGWINILVPDVPQTLQIKIKREQYLAKQILSLTVNEEILERNEEQEEKNVSSSTPLTSDISPEIC